MDNNKEKLRTIALAGNPNVGKSTIFNGLTGLKQHTGNWSGKTVSYANGFCQVGEHTYNIVDIPGAYSLLAHSQEEEVARDYLCFGARDAIIVVCDSTCLERNLNLLLQILEFTSKVVVCVNLLDEAAKKGIKINLPLLEEMLGVPVVGTVAHHKDELKNIFQRVEEILTFSEETPAERVQYPAYIEEEISHIRQALPLEIGTAAYRRWLSLRLLENDQSFRISFAQTKMADLTVNAAKAAAESRKRLQAQGIESETLTDEIVSAILQKAQAIAQEVVSYENNDCHRRDRQIDKILTGKISGYICMALLLVAIFWLTIVGANYPSQLLSEFFNHSEVILAELMAQLKVPDSVSALLLQGVWRTVGWVVAVMLPPMAIFFPLFTLLEDVGYLPRIAYNLDKPFKCCRACGKQALTMCMGLGCNAVGVMGCRIIDSPRERLMAILTNSLMPCNGRLSALIVLFSLFMLKIGGELKGIGVAVGMSVLLLLGLLATLAVNKVLSQTILKGVPSSFVLELPSYRKPQVAQVLVQSVFERTLLVLKRAVAVAAPVGALLWILANVSWGEVSLLNYLAAKLDGIGALMGLDGVILLAFILGLPANEIVLPIIIMGYLAEKGLTEIVDIAQLQDIFWHNGWNEVTVVCLLVFMLFHWPCATTIWTIKKESGSWKWCVIAILIPALLGAGLCIMINALAKIFGF